MKVDLISDIVCPWCALGLASLQQALARLPSDVSVTLNFQPFELNPELGPAGEDLTDYLCRRYGITARQIAATQASLQQHGQSLGLNYRFQAPRRIWNTFAAHRLLHWARLQSPQAPLDLSLALFGAYFTEGHNPADPALLLRLVAALGLDATQAQAVLAGHSHAAQVRERQAFWRQAGIRSVPSLIINDRHLIQGFQPPEVLERVLRRILTGGDDGAPAGSSPA